MDEHLSTGSHRVLPQAEVTALQLHDTLVGQPPPEHRLKERPCCRLREALCKWACISQIWPGCLACVHEGLKFGVKKALT